ncbi:MAG: hypothetical protein J6S67_15120 [Methanobrevibacter sp.]|nr:hypothetical protein [Methanobrevibacter sp.]
MIRHSTNGIIEEVCIMMRTGASENTVGDYIDKLYKEEQISERVYSLLIGMLNDYYC